MRSSLIRDLIEHCKILFGSQLWDWGSIAVNDFNTQPHDIYTSMKYWVQNLSQARFPS